MDHVPSRSWSWLNISPVQREHYLLARSFRDEFSVNEFRKRYRKEYPGRPEVSMLISDFAYNNNQRAKARYPSFVERTGRGRYRFVDFVDPVR